MNSLACFDDQLHRRVIGFVKSKQKRLAIDLVYVLDPSILDGIR
jgi:hypothetical protein